MPPTGQQASVVFDLVMREHYVRPSRAQELAIVSTQPDGLAERMPPPAFQVES